MCPNPDRVPQPDDPPRRRGQLLDVRVVEGSDGGCTVELRGELDISTVDRAEAALETAEAGGATRIVLDLSGLEFLDSTGLRLVIRADARSSQNGQRLRIVRGPEQVQRVFELCGLADRLPFA